MSLPLVTPTGSKLGMFIGNPRGRELVILMILTFGQGFLANVLRAVLPVHAVSLGAGIAFTGLMMSIPEGVQVLVRIPAGLMTARIGRRAGLISSFVLSSSSIFLFYQADQSAGLLLPQLTFGIASALFWPTTWAFMTELAPRHLQVKVVGYGMGVSGAGVLIGPLLGGILYDQIGPSSTYLTVLSASVVCLFLSFKLTHVRKAAERAVEISPWAKIRELIGRRPVSTAVGWSLLAALLDGAFSTFLPVYLVGQGASASLVGLILSLRRVTMTGARFVFNHIAGQFNLIWVIGLSLMVDVVAMLGAVVATGPLALGLLSGLGGAANGCIEPGCKVLVARATSDQERPLAMGLEGTFLSFGKSSGSTLVGIIGGLLPLAWAFSATAVGVGFAGATLLRRRSPRSIAEASPAG